MSIAHKIHTRKYKPCILQGVVTDEKCLKICTVIARQLGGSWMEVSLKIHKLLDAKPATYSLFSEKKNGYRHRINIDLVCEGGIAYEASITRGPVRNTTIVERGLLLFDQRGKLLPAQKTSFKRFLLKSRTKAYI